MHLGVNKLKTKVSAAIIILITMLLPLYMENYYFNITQAKGHLYMIGIFLLLSLALIITIISIFTHEHLRLQRNLLDYFMIALAIAAAVSTCLASDFTHAFWGTYGFSIGGFSLITLVGVYFVISRWAQPKKWMKYGFFVAMGIVFLMGILDSIGIDPLGKFKDIAADQQYWYISTIGNINAYAGWLCLAVPFLLLEYVRSFGNEKSRDMKKPGLYHILLWLAALNMVLCASDSLIAGLGIAAFFAIPYLAENDVQFRKICPFVTMYGLALLAVGILPVFAAKKNAMGGISGELVRYHFGILFVVAGVLIPILMKKISSKVIGRYLVCFLATMAGYKMARMVMSLSEAFGTGRGQIWKEALSVYAKFDLKSKLFGCGPELFGQTVSGLTDKAGLTVVTAHSEPIQMLVTMGAAGLIIYIGIWSCVFATYIKYKKNKQCPAEEYMLYFLPLTAYFGQGLFNSGMSVQTALFFLCLALYRRLSVGTYPVDNISNAKVVNRVRPH